MPHYDVVIETRASQEGFRAYATECPPWLPAQYFTGATREAAADALKARLRRQFPGESFDFIHAPL